MQGTASCIFIDSLDEIQSSERTEIVAMVISLCSLLNVKVCATSRPETLFQRKLGSYPMIRVQDFTKASIRLHVKSSLEEYRTFLDEDAEIYGQLVDMLVEKSEGVFLWVKLAVNSLTRGMVNGDTAETMLQRIDQLSPGIYKLFKQLWARNNEDLPLYRREAAELFWFHILSWAPMSVFKLDLVCHLLGTHSSLREEVQRSIVAQGSCSVEDEMRISRVYSSWLAARSAGFLEVKGQHSEPASITMSHRDGDFSRFHWEVGFIHRSVSEFFRTTIDGQAILNYDPRPLTEKFLAVIKANIAFNHFPEARESKENFIQLYFGVAVGFISAVLPLGDEQWELMDPYRLLSECPAEISPVSRSQIFGVAASSGIVSFFSGHRAEIYRSFSPQEMLEVMQDCCDTLVDYLSSEPTFFTVMSLCQEFYGRRFPALQTFRSFLGLMSTTWEHRLDLI